MSKAVRGSLSGLSSRLAPKPMEHSGTQSADVSQPAHEPRAEAQLGPKQRDLKTMMCRVNRAGWQEMSRLAIDTGENLEDLLIEACNDFLRKNGRPPVIEKRSPTAKA